MKAQSASTAEIPVKELLAAAYGPSKVSAQLLALFLTHFFALTALHRKLAAQGNASSRVRTLEQGYARALAVYIVPLVEEAQKAVRTGDARFFKDFANALEEPRRTSRGRDPVRGWLLMHKLKNAAPQTVRQIKASLFTEARCDVGERQIYRLCEELEIAVAKGQEGRPRKTPTKQQKQGRSFK
jgi:hypothetical protein